MSGDGRYTGQAGIEREQTHWCDLYIRSVEDVFGFIDRRIDWPPPLKTSVKKQLIPYLTKPRSSLDLCGEICTITERYLAKQLKDAEPPYDVRPEDLSIAVIISGSVGRMEPHEDSDLDFLVIVDDDRLAEALLKCGNRRQTEVTEWMNKTLNDLVTEIHSLDLTPDMTFDEFKKDLQGQKRAFHCWTRASELRNNVGGGIQNMELYHPRWFAIMTECVRIWDPTDLVLSLRNQLAEFVGLNTSGRLDSDAREFFVNNYRTQHLRNRFRIEGHTNPFRRTMKTLGIRPASSFASFLLTVAMRLEERPWEQRDYLCALSAPTIVKLRICWQIFTCSTHDCASVATRMFERLLFLYFNYIDWYRSRGRLWREVDDVLMTPESRSAIAAIDLIIEETNRIDGVLRRSLVGQYPQTVLDFSEKPGGFYEIDRLLKAATSEPPATKN